MLYGAFSLACLFALLLLLSQLFNYPLGVKVWQWHVLHNVCTLCAHHVHIGALKLHCAAQHFQHVPGGHKRRRGGDSAAPALLA